MKVYIYCTKAKPYLAHFNNRYYDLVSDNFRILTSKPIKLNGKIVASFELNRVSKIEVDSKQYNYWSKNGSCLSIDDFINYCKGKDLYAWHIENLEIIEPLELGEFNLKKAPKNFQYAYYKGEKVIILSVKSEWVEKILNGKKTIEVRKTAPKEMLK